METIFGVWKVNGIKRCNVMGCKGIAHNYIGNNNSPNLRTNLFPCDKHLEIIYNELSNKYNTNTEPLKPTLNASNTIDNVNSQELTNKYLEMLYGSGGMTNKEKLKEFCTENGIKLPKDVDELKTKGYMELIFPGILVKEGEK